MYFSVLCRAFSCSSVVSTKQWRESMGLPANKTSEGVLTDGPDYTFLDGRPTPLLVNIIYALSQGSRDMSDISLKHLHFTKIT
jgi:hypothetical protein